jgi:hypothetical protein
MQYRTSWQSTSSADGDSIGPGERRVIEKKSVVDGWGNLLIPNPYNYAEGALRVNEQTIETDYLNGNITRSDTTIRYHFYTTMLFSATITTDTRNRITGAIYTVNFIQSSGVAPEVSTEGLSLFITPNPVSNSVAKVIYTLKNDGPVRIELMDMLGKIQILKIGYAVAGQYVLEIDPHTLAPGVYFVRIESAKMSTMQKLVVSR